MMQNNPTQAAHPPIPTQTPGSAPMTAEAQIALLVSLFEQGRYADMESAARDAILRHPEHGISWKALCMALQFQGRNAEALEPLRRAAQLLPNDIDICFNLSEVLLAAGRPAEAQASLRRALALNPRHVPAHFSLGRALADCAQHAEAESSYRAALALDPSVAEGHNNLGVLLLDRQRPDEAEASFRQALSLKQAFAEAHGNLGLALKEQGRLTEAVAAFEIALALKPDFVHAHFTLSTLANLREGQDFLERLEALRQEAPQMPLPTRVRYWFALGKWREDAGQYDASFAAYHEGNRLQHGQIPIDEAGEEALVERVIATFSRDYLARAPLAIPESVKSAPPILIVGMPRSGTTLLEQILASCPGVAGVGEVTDLHDTVKAAMPGRDFSFYPDAVTLMGDGALAGIAADYSQALAKRAPQALRVVDKLLSNFLFIGLLHRILPGVKIIHAMRHPMDTCFSNYACLFDQSNLNFAYDLGTLGRCYRRYARLMRHWHAVLPPGAILDVRYEDVVADTEGQARRVLDYLGMPWDDNCLAFHRNERKVKTVSAAQVRRPIYRSSLSRWKRFELHLDELRAALGDELAHWQ
jgi:Tfp pilus assembly protein PilF